MELRTLVRADVAARNPVDEREARSIAEFLAAFDRLASPFDEHADPVHVTGSAIVVGPRGVVLLRHKRLGIWLQPGGHIDDGETPWEAALRETIEETGLAAARLRAPDGSGPDGRPGLADVDVHAGGRGHTHLDLRYLVDVGVDGGDADPVPPEGESQEIGWYAWDEAIAIADDGLRGALLALRHDLT